MLATSALVAVAPVPGAAQEALPAFTATAAANGLRGTATFAGFPGTDVPFDGGGPTAQSAANSTGSADGYAAAPDAGQFIITVPGLVTGLVTAGGFGLPPVDLPTLPDYPFFVASDAYVTPEASLGEGPYRLRATSGDDRVAAEASAGLETGAAGNVALVRSTSSVDFDETGVVATATSEVQGLTVGPLSIGSLRSTATMTMSPTGTREQESSIAIDAVTLAGFPITIGPDGISLVGVDVPLPIEDTLEQLLSSALVQVEFVPEQTFDDRVVAGAIRLTFPVEMPAPVPPLGQLSGSVTVTLGAATASVLSGAPGAPPTTPRPTDEASAPAAPTSGPSSGGSSPVAPRPSSGGAVATPAAPTTPVLPAASAASTSTPLVLDLWSIRVVYLVSAAAAAAMFILGQAVRQLGVRRPWTS